MRFVVGDVVTLKSGGPKMTVVEISGQSLSVQYFTKGEVLKTAEFTPNMLLSSSDVGAVHVHLPEGARDI